MQAAADPQPAGQAVHLDSLTSYQKTISNRKLTLFTTLQILQEVHEICFKEITVFLKSVWGLFISLEHITDKKV